MSGPPAVARRRSISGLGAGLAWVAVVAGGCSSDKVSNVEVTSVAVRPASVSLIAGESRRFTADVRDQDGNVVPSSIVTWSVTPSTVLAVDDVGLVQALAPGTGTVRATAQGVSGTATVTVEPPPTIRVTPGSATLAGLLGGSPPPDPVDLLVENAGAGTLSGLGATVSYPAGSPSGWLSPSLGGTTAPTTLRLSASSSGLQLGEYEATVRLTSAGAVNSPLEIPVRLRVLADQPVIRATPALVGFSGVSGGPRPPEQVVVVENIGGGTLDDLQVSLEYEGAMSGWLAAALSGVVAPAELSLEADPAPLVPGTYRARARLQSAKALNSPRDVVVELTVQALSDLRVVKLGPDSTAAGTTASYTIELRNEGPSAAESVVLVDSLPANTTLVSVPPGAVLEDGVLTWDLGGLAAGVLRTFSAEVAVPPAGVGILRNVATAVSPTSDPSPESRTSAVAASLYRLADLEIFKTGPDSVFAGAGGGYRIVAHNRGPSDAVAVVVRDTLPANATLVSATGNPTQAGRALSWPATPTLVPGDSVVFEVAVAVASDETGTLVNKARVSSATRDPQAGNGSVTVVTPIVVYADLEAGAEAPDTVPAGTQATFTAAVRNRGPSDAAAVVVRDTLPPGLTFVSATGGGVATGQVVTWPAIPVLAPGDSVGYEVVATVGSGVVGEIVHRVVVVSSTGDPGPTPNVASDTTWVSTRADLGVIKRGPAVDTAGTVADYTVVVRNDGPSDALGVVLQDSLPVGASLVAASDGGTASAGVVVWPTVATLAAGDSLVRSVRVLLDPAGTGTAVNVARVTSATEDPDALDNRASLSTALLTSADLAVTKTGPVSATAGGTATYTVTVVNAGPSAATGTVVTDTLPAGVTFVSASDGGVAAGGVVSWPAATVGPGTSREVELTVRIDAGRTTPVTNVAAVTSTVTDPSSLNNRATTTTPIQVAADVSVVKTAPAVDTAGTSVAFGLTVANAGPSTATGVVVSDTLPLGVTFVSATGGGTYSAATRAVTWPAIATLASGADQAFTVNATVDGTTSGAVVNRARVTSTSTDPVAADNRSQTSTNVVAVADVSVVKTAPAVDTAGTSIAFGLTVANAGPSAAAGVVVSDTLPLGVTFVSATGGGTYSAATRAVTWPAIATLANGANQAFTVNATLDAAASGAVVNRARVTSTSADPAAANDRSQTSTNVVAAADVSVVKTAPAVDTAGTSIAFGLTVANAGPSAATGVVVSDTLPLGVTFVSATGGGTYSAATRAVTWPAIATLANGANQAFTVNATVDGTTSGAVVNRAQVTSTSADPAAANDRSQTSTNVVAVADVSVVKTAPAVDTAGTSIAFGLTVANAGPSTATGIVVSDTLPVGVTFVSATGGGTYSAATRAVTWPAIATLANGANQAFTVNATVDGTTSGAVVNRARVTSTSADPTAANDRSQTSTNVVAVADVSVVKTAPAVDTAGTSIAFGLTVANAGPSAATGVVVSDTLPVGVTFVSATGGGTYSAATRAVTWPAIATLANGANQAFTVDATVDGTTTGAVVNRARVTATSADPTPADDRSQTTTTVSAVADLAAGATAPATAAPGDQITFTVSVVNTGPSTATGVVVADTLPAGVTFVSATGGGTLSAGVVTWPAIASLAAGAPAATFDVVVDVDLGFSGSLVNIVGVAGAEPDPVVADNRATSTTTVSAPSPAPRASDASVGEAGTVRDRTPRSP